MRALDTNVFVRIILWDDDAQATFAARIIAEPCLLIPTVALEIAWVLGTVLSFTRQNIVARLRALLEFPALRIVDRDSLGSAITMFEAGADFTDTYHLASSTIADSFATFDRKIERHRLDGQVRVELLG